MQIKLVERDYLIINEIYRWNCCLGRHIKILAGFSGQRACDRRLKILIENQYIERKRILYGVPAIYSLTTQSKKLFHISQKKQSIKIEQIRHDINVLDTAIYLMKKYNIPLNNIKTEKQLHSMDGFGTRKHRPDFIYIKDGKTYCVEIEMSVKAKPRLETIVKDNFSVYNFQKWFVPEEQTKIKIMLQDIGIMYPIEILSLNEVLDYVRNL